MRTTPRPGFFDYICHSCRNQARIQKPKVNLRVFSQQTRLLLLAPRNTRPQLPFLHPANAVNRGSNAQSMLRLQMGRLLTTHTKQFIREQVRRGGKIAAVIWTFYGLVALVVFGLQTEMLDRRYPVPPEWSWLSKYKWRCARNSEEVDAEKGIIDWSGAGDAYIQLIKRLEDLHVDGQGLEPTLKGDGDIYVEGVGKAGFDISAKSEAWRRGYFQSLMGLARAAEHQEGWVMDKKQKSPFPPHVVVQDAGTQPSRLYKGGPMAPLEEDCEPLFESPTIYYMKILTTQGFNSRQRLDAALAYSRWLDEKGLVSTAEDMCDWALDIAMGALPQGIKETIDIQSGILSDKADYVSSNMLRASTGLAIHHARTGNLAASLPIFLSVLRAQRTFFQPAAIPEYIAPATGFWSVLWHSVKSLAAPRPYPEPPSSGDDLPERTPAMICDEATLMSHIGEILFASATDSAITSASEVALPTKNQIESQNTGLAWTRDAVDLAETTLNSTNQQDFEGCKKCSETLRMSMSNWSTMIDEMIAQDTAAKEKQLQSTTSKKSIAWSQASQGPDQVELPTRWEHEASVVDKRVRRVEQLIRDKTELHGSVGILSTVLGTHGVV